MDVHSMPRQPSESISPWDALLDHLTTGGNPSGTSRRTASVARDAAVLLDRGNYRTPGRMAGSRRLKSKIRGGLGVENSIFWKVSQIENLSRNSAANRKTPTRHLKEVIKPLDLLLSGGLEHGWTYGRYPFAQLPKRSMINPKFVVQNKGPTPPQQRAQTFGQATCILHLECWNPTGSYAEKWSQGKNPLHLLHFAARGWRQCSKLCSIATWSKTMMERLKIQPKKILMDLTIKWSSRIAKQKGFKGQIPA